MKIPKIHENSAKNKIPKIYENSAKNKIPKYQKKLKLPKEVKIKLFRKS